MANRQAPAPFTRRSLLEQQRGIKEPTRTTKERRGSVQNSGASLQPPRPDVNAGRAEKETAAFIGQMREFVFGKGMVMDQWMSSEKERGIASFNKSTAEQRKKYADAINNGWIDAKDSYAFREGVTEAHTTNLLNKASLQIYTDYAKWEGKNDPSSGAFEGWLQDQDDKIAINLESIPDDTLSTHFHEQWQQIKRNLSLKHSAHLNQQFEDQSYDTIEQRIFNLLYQNDGVLSADLQNNKDLKMPELLNNQRYIEKDYQRVGRFIAAHDKNGKLSSKQLDELEMLAHVEGGVYKNVYNELTKDEVSLDDFEQQLAGVKSPSRSITKYTLPEIAEGTYIPREFWRQVPKGQSIIANTEGISSELIETIVHVAPQVRLEDIPSQIKWYENMVAYDVGVDTKGLAPSKIKEVKEAIIAKEATGFNDVIADYRIEPYSSYDVTTGNSVQNVTKKTSKVVAKKMHESIRNDAKTVAGVAILEGGGTINSTFNNMIKLGATQNKALAARMQQNSKQYVEIWNSYLREYYGVNSKLALQENKIFGLPPKDKKELKGKGEGFWVSQKKWGKAQFNWKSFEKYVTNYEKRKNAKKT